MKREQNKTGDFISVHCTFISMMLYKCETHFDLCKFNAYCKGGGNRAGLVLSTFQFFMNSSTKDNFGNLWDFNLYFRLNENFKRYFFYGLRNIYSLHKLSGIGKHCTFHFVSLLCTMYSTYTHTKCSTVHSACEKFWFHLVVVHTNI